MAVKFTTPGEMKRDSKPNRYYRNAVERHWDPAEIDIEPDLSNLESFAEDSEMTEADFDSLRAGLAKFGAGEEAVTEDLAPLAVILEDIDEQMFLTTHLYEEAKHADFFERYWREVLNEFENVRGWEQSDPKEDRWFNDAYYELFDRVRKAMHRPLESDTPESRAKAYIHYMLVVEGIAAQTGYYAFQRNFSGEFDELPELPGLVEGFSNIRSDEGRHVGFGMYKLKQLLEAGDIEFSLVEETVDDLVPLVIEVVNDERYLQDDRGVPPEELMAYAQGKHQDRMAQIERTALPDVETLVELED